MSKVPEIERYVTDLMARNHDGIREQAILNINQREETPDDMEMAIRGELQSIRMGLIKDKVIETWTEMFKETIDQANSSHNDLFVKAMLAALFTTHKTIQSEFWLNMFKVMETIAKAENHNFDLRNEWTKKALDRLIYAHSHSAEVDALRAMSPEALWEFRCKHGCNA